MWFQPNFPQLDLQNTDGHSKYTGYQLGEIARGEVRVDKNNGLKQLLLNIQTLLNMGPYYLVPTQGLGRDGYE